MFTSPILILVVSFALLQLCSAGAGHAAGAKEWEFEGYVDLHPSAEHGNYTLYFHKNTKTKAYADATFKLVTYKTTDLKTASLSAAEHEADELWEGNWTKAMAQEIVLSANTAYELTFDQDAFISEYKLSIPSDGLWVFYMQHFPSEFDFEIWDNVGTKYTLTDLAPPKAPNTANDGVAFLGTFITNVCTFSGVLFVFYFGSQAKTATACTANDSFLLKMASCFGAGALAACAFTIMVPESVRILTATFKSSEADANSAIGGFVMFGILITVMIEWLSEILIGNTDEDRTDVAKAKDVEDPNAVAVLTNREWTSFNPLAWKGVAYGVLLGDFLHNIVDGAVIVMTFRSCEVARGWAIVLGVVAHEVPQEIADFFVLITQGKLTFAEALSMNFLSGASAFIGAGMAAAGAFQGTGEGYLLAFSGGVYIAIALVNCMPQLQKQKSLFEFAVFSVSVIAAAGIIMGVARLHSHGCGEGGDHAHSH